MAWDSLRPREVWPGPQDSMWVAQRSCSFASKLNVARSCMGRHISVDSLRLREARPEFHCVASTGKQMAWDRLRLREARPGLWLSEARWCRLTL